ncbi:MAG: lysophospholipid acyltransferase family protein [Devosiaceae bacterium]
MPQFRALAANAVFYLNTLVWLIICLPLLAGPPRWSLLAVQAWAKMTMWLLRIIAGIKWEIRGLENLPRENGKMQGCIIASKHQSTWETFGLFPYLENPVYILKQELMSIPIFGWFSTRAGMISVDRKKGASALREMTKDAREAVANGRQLIIFPEGTRKPVGAEPEYKSGVTHLYKQLEVPLVPTALNAGLFWPRRKMERYPGTLVVSILPAIPAGQDPKATAQLLQERIEAETDKLVADERAINPQLPPA